MSKKKRKKQKPLVQLVLPTPPQQDNQSEVAILLWHINQEYQSAQWGLSGLAYGTSQHQFITACMENMERAREQLVEIVGDPNEATRLVVEQMNKSAEGKEST